MEVARLETILEEIDAGLSLWEKLEPTLGALDILFFFLGVSAAYNMVARRDEEDEVESEEAEEPAEGGSRPSTRPAGANRQGGRPQGRQQPGVKLPKRRTTQR